MKLLGLRLCEHDSNMSYFDGTKVHYYKSERDYQIKHHGYDELKTWRGDIQRVFNVRPEEIDDIAIVICPWRHNLPKNNEEFLPRILKMAEDIIEKNPRENKNLELQNQPYPMPFKINYE